MNVQAKSKILWSIFGFGMIGALASPFIVKNFLPVQRSSKIYLNPTLIEASGKIQKEFSNIKEENKAKEEKINKIIEDWEKNTSNEENKILNLNKLIDSKNINKNLIESLITWYSPFKINLSDLKTHLFSKYFNVINEISNSENGISLQNNLTSENIIKLQNLKIEIESYILSLLTRAKEIYNKTQDPELLTLFENSGDFLLDSTYELITYLEAYKDKLNSFTEIKSNNYIDLIDVLKSFFVTSEKQILKINAALNQFINNLNARLNILNEELRSLNLIKEINFNSIEILKKYLNQNRNLVDLLKHDSEFIHEIIASNNTTNVDKELVYKTYLFAYSKKFNNFTEGITNLLYSVLEMEGISEDKVKYIQNLINEIREIRSNNKQYIDIANQPFENIKTPTDISVLLKFTASVNYKILSDIVDLVNMFIIETEQNKEFKENVFKALLETNQKISNWTLKKEKNNIKKAMVEKQIQEINSLLKDNSIDLNTKNDLNAKIKVLEKEKQKLQLLENEISMQVDLQKTKYNETAKQAVDLVSNWAESSIVLKYLNFSLSSLFGESNSNITIIKDLKNQILNITKNNNELEKNYESAKVEHNKKIENLNNEIDSLKLQNELHAETNRQYGLQIKNLNDKIGNLSLVKRNLNANIILLNQEINNLRKENENSNLTLEKKEALINEINSKIDEERVKLQTIENELEKVQNEKSELLLSFTKLEKENVSLIENIDRLTAEKNNLETLVRELEEKNENETTTLNNEISRITNENINLENNLSRIATELEEHKNEITNKVNDIEKLKTDIATLRTTTANEISLKNAEKAKLEELLKASNSEIDNLEKRYAEYVATNDKKQNELKLLLATKKQENEELVINLKNKISEIEIANTKINSLTKLNEDLSSEKLSVEEKLRIANEALGRSKETENRLNNEISKLKNDIETIKNEAAKELEAKNIEKQKLETSLAATNSKINDLESKYNLALEENRLSNTEKERLLLLIDAAKEEKTKLLLNIDSLNKKINDDNDKMASLISLNKQLSNDKIALEEKLNEANKVIVAERKRKNDQEWRADVYKTGYEEMVAKFNNLNNKLNTEFSTLKTRKDELEKEVNELSTKLQDEVAKNKRITAEFIAARDELILEIEALKVKELAYGKLVIKANGIIKRVIGILKTFRKWEIHNKLPEIKFPPIKYDVVIDANGYTRRYVPVSGGPSAAVAIAHYNALKDFNAVVHKHNGEEIIAEAMEVLKEWELSEELETQINNLIEENDEN